ncbi:rRNA methyltransferase 3, mitochondrial [Megachile rotundata]|uniref:rRNA methyltransferase 3, mitochondrial n=1 Tax=Megachile rotundata TaxID=143995 RepID=UPI003FD58F93
MVFLNVVRNAIRPLYHVNTCQLVNVNITRQYCRWTSRRPIAIVNEDELYETEDTATEKPIRMRRRRHRRRKSSDKTQESSVKTEEPSETKQTNMFTKLRENEKIIINLMSQIKTRKRREKNNEVVLEGHRLIKDALKAGLVPKAVFFNDFSEVKSLNLPDEVKLYKVPYKSLQLWSALTTSPGLLGIFDTPDVSNNPSDNHTIPLTIICDNIREPGNLGSIMRAAVGVGCEKLILLKGCVDLWDPKVLRSAAGSHFRLPIHAFPKWDEVPSLISEDSNIIVADSNFGDEYVSHYTPNMLESSACVFDIDPDILKNKLAVDGEKNEESKLIIPTNKKMMKQFMLNLPIVPYYSLDYTKKETVIILSGETEGLHIDSCKFLSEKKGIRVNIPLMKGVDSLNAGVALGIVTFEIKRQFLKKQSEL